MPSGWMNYWFDSNVNLRAIIFCLMVVLAAWDGYGYECGVNRIYPKWFVFWKRGRPMGGKCCCIESHHIARVGHLHKWSLEALTHPLLQRNTRMILVTRYPGLFTFSWIAFIANGYTKYFCSNIYHGWISRSLVILANTVKRKWLFLM